MNVEQDQFEREVERQFAELRDRLAISPPDPALIDNLGIRLASEAARYRKRRGRLPALRPLLGAAAALTLIITLNMSAVVVGSASSDPESVVIDWVRSLGDTESQFTRLFESERQSRNQNLDEQSEDAGGLFNSLEESFESFESIIGA